MKYSWIPLLLLLIACSGREGVENILIKGSDTEVNLALVLAETYMEKDPNISLAVTGGGSGLGIAALINGRTDIANSSRPMKKEEVKQAQDRGIDPQSIIFAVDALALVVNENLAIDSLTLNDISRIYKGDITNWSELGGPDLPISLYGRQSNSGTFIYFRENVIRAEYSQQVKQMNGTAQIVEAVKTDEAAIGYVGLGYVVDKEGRVAEDLKVLSVAPNDTINAFSPLDRENILSGEYEITRPLFQYMNGKPKGKLLDYILFELGEEGQQIVSDNGYYQISKKYIEINKKILGEAYNAQLDR